MDNNVIEDIKEVIDNVMGENLFLNIKDIELTTNLYDLGLDSLNIVKLIIGVENRFEIEFADDDLASDNWATIEKIAKIVNERNRT